MMYMAYRRFEWKFLRRPDAWGFTVICLVPFVYWYFIHVPYLNGINNLEYFYRGHDMRDAALMLADGRYNYFQLVKETIPEAAMGWGLFLLLIGYLVMA